MPSRLTVVTGPTGVDIGPVAAKLGAQLDDGLAIRVVTASTVPHTSPDPYHRHTLNALSPSGCDGTTSDNRSMAAVRLERLPSAWQDPQTNLGVVYERQPDVALNDDIHTLDALGLDPGYRLTVQSNIGSVMHVHHPVEVGNLAVHARDAVLRAGGRVQIEAGEGLSLLDALSLVGIPPWASWIGHLDRWIVLDVQTEIDRLGAYTREAVIRDFPGTVQTAVNALDGSSGAYTWGGSTGHVPGPTLRVALLNAQMLIPGIAAHDHTVSTGAGDPPTEEDGARLADLLDAVHDRAGVEIHLIGTGHIAGTGVWSWIDSGEWGA